MTSPLSLGNSRLESGSIFQPAILVYLSVIFEIASKYEVFTGVYSFVFVIKKGTGEPHSFLNLSPNTTRISVCESELGSFAFVFVFSKSILDQGLVETCEATWQNWSIYMTIDSQAQNSQHPPKLMLGILKLTQSVFPVEVSTG